MLCFLRYLIQNVRLFHTIWNQKRHCIYTLSKLEVVFLLKLFQVWLNESDKPHQIQKCGLFVYFRTFISSIHQSIIMELLMPSMMLHGAVCTSDLCRTVCSDMHMLPCITWLSISPRIPSRPSLIFRCVITDNSWGSCVSLCVCVCGFRGIIEGP